MDDIKIGRINELARKQREGTLTAEERFEQQLLRREYIDEVKAQISCALGPLDKKSKD